VRPACVPVRCRWHYFDDSRVTEADEADVQSPAAYVLFYRCVLVVCTKGVCCPVSLCVWSF
jgi:hypothetical protein